MQHTYNTSRLELNELALEDSEFISELVNSPEWIKFIGERNVRSKEQSEEYIGKITGTPGINYWVVKIKDTQIPAGIVTFIRRDYLDYPDIGFAFLSRFSKQGFAYEATEVVFNDVKKDHSQILAITIKENTASIRLLEKLGFHFDREMKRDGETLQVYVYISN